MRAVVMEGTGGPEVLHVREVTRPRPGPEELLVRVRASALNRADLQLRAGEFPLPSGMTPILGVEVAGEVVDLGADVRGFERGQRVAGLVNGGGYAEYCVLDHRMALPVRAGESFTHAAALPEALVTADEVLFELGQLRAGQSVLVHAGGSGMGSMCLQMAHHAGATVYFTVSTEERLRRARELGGDVGILRATEDFASAVLRHTQGAGVDVVVDFAGGATLARNLQALKTGGCLVLVGLLEGERAELDVEAVVMRRLQLKGTAFRGRPLNEKRAITHRAWARWGPELEAGRVRPVVDSVFPFERVADAHRHMADGTHFGKILLALE
ncbi:NAD(P)H-quinone oxidoreductase [Myxococcaceae bacterium JPH2]|nr:NAD(P)H-quinone oxidoreductase [Myxococcaceae bacterium JPH2]